MLVLTSLLMMPLSGYAEQAETAKSDTATNRTMIQVPVNEPGPFSMGGLAGIQWQPTQFALAGHFDYRLSEYFSITQLNQVGFNNVRGYGVFSGGGKFHIGLTHDKGAELVIQDGHRLFLSPGKWFQFS